MTFYDQNFLFILKLKMDKIFFSYFILFDDTIEKNEARRAFLYCDEQL